MLEKKEKKYLNILYFLRICILFILIIILFFSLLPSKVIINYIYCTMSILDIVNFAILFDYILISTANHHILYNIKSWSFKKRLLFLFLNNFNNFGIFCYIFRKNNENEKSCNQNQEFHQTNVWFCSKFFTFISYQAKVFIFRECFNCISVAYSNKILIYQV